MAKLIDICDVQYGYPFDSKQFSDSEGMPLIRIRDVVRGFSETYTTEKYNEEYVVHEGDMLVGMDGEFNIAKWGKIPALLNQRVCKIIPKESVFGNYIYYAMPKALKEIEDRTPFVTVKHLSAKEINKISIPLPPLETQKQIAANLDKVTHTIDLCNNILEKLDLLVKARFVEMFGDFKTNTKGWKVAKFTDIAIIDGNMTTDFEKYADYPHIGIDSIEKDTGDLKGYRTIAEDNVVSGKYLFTPQHIIYSKIRPNLNKVALPNFNGVCSADAYPILPDSEKCNRLFLAYVMRSSYFLDYILQFCNRTNLPKVNRKEVSGFSTPLPPIELQEQFATFVEQTDKSKSAVKQVLEKAETLKKALMQEYFG